MKKTLIAGLGNPILGDDGVGWVVAKKVASQLGDSISAITTESFSLAGIALMEQMIGYDRIILIDSFNTGNFLPGKLITLTLDNLDDLTVGHSASAHDLSLKSALALGRSLNVDLPDDQNVFIVAVEARHLNEFSESLTPEVEASVPGAVTEVIRLLNSD